MDLVSAFTEATDDWELWLTIGMLFSVEEIVYPQLAIPPECVQMLNGNKIGIDMTLYPGSGDPSPSRA